MEEIAKCEEPSSPMTPIATFRTTVRLCNGETINRYHRYLQPRRRFPMASSDWGLTNWITNRTFGRYEPRHLHPNIRWNDYDIIKVLSHLYPGIIKEWDSKGGTIDELVGQWTSCIFNEPAGIRLRLEKISTEAAALKAKCFTTTTMMNPKIRRDVLKFFPLVKMKKMKMLDRVNKIWAL